MKRLTAFAVIFMTCSASAQFAEINTRAHKKANELVKPTKDNVRPQIGKSYRVRLGLQIHPSCWRAVRAQRLQKTELSDHDLEIAAERLVDRAITKVVEDCDSGYPELRPYIKGWIAQARSTLVTCADKPLTDAAAANYSIKASVRDLPADVQKDIKDDLKDVDDDEYLSRHYKSIIEFDPGEFTDAMRAFGHNQDPSLESLRVGGASTLIHEVFHSTGANNRADHNDVERLHPKSKKECMDNVSVDRVAMLENLCSGDNVQGTLDGSAEMIYQRISLCGEKHGCTKLFTSVQHSTWWERFREQNEPSTGLSERAARSVCAKIYDDGLCRHFRKTQTESLLTGNATLKELTPKIRERFDQLLPARPTGFPKALLETFTPNLRSGLESFQSTPCFKSVFTREPNGDLTVNGYEAGRSVNIPDRLKGNTVFQLFARASRLMGERSECQGEEGFKSPTAQKISAALAGMEKEFGHYVWSDPYEKTAMNRYLGRPEKVLSNQTISDYLSARARNKPEILYARRFMGNELFEKYYQALSAANPSLDNEKFDCAPLKVRSAFFTSEEGRSALNPSKPKTCPGEK